MIPGLDIDILKTFIAIADTGSYSRAADEVGRTQSAVSMQVKRLEALIDKTLLVKQGRSNRLTHDGEHMLDYARRIVQLNDEAMAAFDKSTFNCKVRLGSTDKYAERFLPDILGRFSRTHPLVQLDVVCSGGSQTLKKMTMDGALHLAIIGRDEEIPNAEPLRREMLVWMTSSRHNVHEKSPLPVATAQNGCSWRAAALAALEKVGRDCRIAYASDSSQAVVAAVRAGLAVGVAPSWYLQAGMRILTENEGFPNLGHFEIGLVRTPRKMPRAGHALAAHIKDAMIELDHLSTAAE